MFKGHNRTVIYGCGVAIDTPSLNSKTETRKYLILPKIQNRNVILEISSTYSRPLKSIISPNITRLTKVLVNELTW